MNDKLLTKFPTLNGFDAQHIHGTTKQQLNTIIVHCSTAHMIGGNDDL